MEHIWSFGRRPQVVCNIGGSGIMPVQRRAPWKEARKTATGGFSCAVLAASQQALWSAGGVERVVLKAAEVQRPLLEKNISKL